MLVFEHEHESGIGEVDACLYRNTLTGGNEVGWLYRGIPLHGMLSLKAIQSFADSVVEDFFISCITPRRVGWSGVASVAMRKLDMIDYADKLDDLRSPPGNRLEALKGDLAGFHSIRINDQWRVVLCWTDAGPAEVRIVDYH